MIFKIRDSITIEAETKTHAEEATRLQAEMVAKPARMKTKKPAQTDPLAEIKNALATGTLAGPEAIDQAYQLGFQTDEYAACKAA